MTIQAIKRITTADTKRTYDLPGEDIPQLWAAQIKIECVSKQGHYSFNNTFPTKAEIFLERKTLENAGLLPMSDKRKMNHDVEQTETAEDLIIRLLEHLGFYPQE